MSEEKEKNLKRLCASLLFFTRLSKSELKKWGINLDDELFDALKERLSKVGLLLIDNKDDLTLAPDPDAADFLQEKTNAGAKERSLSESMSEILTLVLYCAPISKAEIDFVRGVNSSYGIRALTEAGFLTRKKDGMRTIYTPDSSVFAHLGLSSAEELPNYEEFRAKIKDLLNS